MKNKIEDLRDHLFATLEALRDTKNPMPIERAKAISDVAQTIINSAKVEVDFLKATDRVSGTEFIDIDARNPLPPPRTSLLGNR